MPSESSQPILSESLAAGDGNATIQTGGAVTPASILWPLVLSLLGLGVVAIFTFNPTEFWDLARHVNVVIIALALGTIVLRILFGGWRLHYLSHGHLTFRNGIRSQLAWDFFANITPPVIGGGPIASAYISRALRIPLGEATSILLFAMLLDQVSFAFTIPVILVLDKFLEVIPRSLGAAGFWSITAFFVGFMLWVAAFAYITLFRPQVFGKIVNRLFRMKTLRRFQPRVLAFTDQLSARSKLLRTQPFRFYVKGFGLTLLPWINRYLLAVFIIWSVYPELDKWLAFLRAIALNLASVGLPTPGGAGGLEALYVLFLGSPLVPKALVAPTLLTWRLLAYYIFVVVGVVMSMRHVHRAVRNNRVGRNRTGEASAAIEGEVEGMDSIERRE